MLTTKILQTIKCFQMVNDNDRILIGLSGGPDSVALTYILHSLRHTLGIELITAHFNHQLRGNAGEDENFCRKLSRELGLTFVIGTDDISLRARQTKESLEDTARKARYLFLSEQAARYSCAAVAVGHSQDDQAETLMMRLIRGSGMRGLASIYPIVANCNFAETSSKLRLIRPLLEVDRREIKVFLSKNQIAYREDPSNSDKRFTRNRLRHDIIPAIVAGFNPRLTETLSASAEIFRAEEDYMNMMSHKWFNQIAERSNDKIKISVSLLNNEHLALVRRVVRLAFYYLRGTTRNLSKRNVDSLLSMLKPGKSGREIHLPGVIVKRSFDQLILSKMSARIPAKRNLNVKKGYNTYEYLFTIPSRISVREGRGSLTSRLATPAQVGKVLEPAAGNSVVVGLTSKVLELKIRSWRPLDRFQPIGAPGSKRLTRYLMEQQVDKNDRCDIPLVVRADSNEILWVVGYAVSEAARVSDSCHRVYLDWVSE